MKVEPAPTHRATMQVTLVACSAASQSILRWPRRAWTDCCGSERPREAQKGHHPPALMPVDSDALLCQRQKLQLLNC